MRILLADDQATVRSALQLLLEENPELDVVGEATEAGELLAQAKMACPDLVLLDWELPGLQTADLLPALRQHLPRLVVIALSGRPEARRSALAAGVDAFVSKGDPPERLLATLNGCCRKGGVR
jgi:DNA-binding NarL/FixJ family response regulator